MWVVQVLKFTEPQWRMLKEYAEAHPEPPGSMAGRSKTLRALVNKDVVNLDGNSLTPKGVQEAIARGYLPRWDDDVREQREKIIQGLKPDEVLLLDAMDDPCIAISREMTNQAYDQGCTPAVIAASKQNFSLLSKTYTRRTIRRLLVKLSLERQGGGG